MTECVGALPVALESGALMCVLCLCAPMAGCSEDNDPCSQGESQWAGKHDAMMNTKTKILRVPVTASLRVVHGEWIRKENRHFCSSFTSS